MTGPGEPRPSPLSSCLFSLYLYDILFYYYFGRALFLGLDGRPSSCDTLRKSGSAATMSALSVSLFFNILFRLFMWTFYSSRDLKRSIWDSLDWAANRGDLALSFLSSLFSVTRPEGKVIWFRAGSLWLPSSMRWTDSMSKSCQLATGSPPGPWTPLPDRAGSVDCRKSSGTSSLSADSVSLFTVAASTPGIRSVQKIGDCRRIVTRAGSLSIICWATFDSPRVSACFFFMFLISFATYVSVVCSSRGSTGSALNHGPRFRLSKLYLLTKNRKSSSNLFWKYECMMLLSTRFL